MTTRNIFKKGISMFLVMCSMATMGAFSAIAEEAKQEGPIVVRPSEKA